MNQRKISVQCMYRGPDGVRFKVSLGQKSEELTIRTNCDRNLRNVDSFCEHHGVSPLYLLQRLIEASETPSNV